ncbi:acetoin utilization protein AcuB [Candidatus Magnetomoraceae bacterium gMMP-1]
MFVSRSMTEKVISIGLDSDIIEVRNLMTENNIRHLVVADENKHLLGIVTDRDIRSALPYNIYCDKKYVAKEAEIPEHKIKNIMTPASKVITITPYDTIQDVLLLMEEKKIGAIPVLDEEKKVIGIISVRDLLGAFIKVMGLGQPGTLIGILMEEKVGQLKKIVDAITEMGISFGSVLVSKHWKGDKRVVFPYLLTNNIGPVKRKLKEMGYTLLNPMEWYLD